MTVNGQHLPQMDNISCPHRGSSSVTVGIILVTPMERTSMICGQRTRSCG